MENSVRHFDAEEWDDAPELEELERLERKTVIWVVILLITAILCTFVITIALGKFWNEQIAAAASLFKGGDYDAALEALEGVPRFWLR